MHIDIYRYIHIYIYTYIYICVPEMSPRDRLCRKEAGPFCGSTYVGLFQNLKDLKDLKKPPKQRASMEFSGAERPNIENSLPCPNKPFCFPSILPSCGLFIDGYALFIP